MLYTYNPEQSKVKNAMAYLQKYCGGFDRTIECSQYTDWSPESQAIIDMELVPRIKEIKETVDKIVQEEELTEIHFQLAEKPVANVKIECCNNEFILIDTLNKVEISRGNVTMIKGLLIGMNQIQNKNGTSVESKNKDKKLPIADDSNEEAF